MKKTNVVLLSAAITAALFVLFQDKVNALANPFGSVEAFAVTCEPWNPAVDATKIAGNDRYKAVRCTNTTSTTVMIGGAPDVSFSNGYPLNNTGSSAEMALTVETSQPLYCVSTGAATAIRCIGGQ